MARPTRGGSAPLLLVHHAVPALSSPDPRTRQAFRRAALLHRMTGGRVRVVALERQPGADPAALERLGIPLVVADHGVGAALGPEVQAAGAVWITDVGAGQAVLLAGGATGPAANGSGPHAGAGRRLPPYVVELDDLPSLAVTASGTRPDFRNSDGLDHLADAHRRAERALLDGAAAVAVTGAALTGALPAGGPAAGPLAAGEPRVVSPCVPAQPQRRAAGQRDGVVHYGRWVGEPGHPDEDGLVDLLAGQPGGPTPEGATDLVVTAVLSQDAPPRQRAALVDRVEVLDPVRWAAAFRTARLAVLPRRFGAAVPAAIAELAAYGLPFLTSALAVAGLPPALAGHVVHPESPEGWRARIERLRRDDRAWTATSRALEELAADWLDPDRIARETAELLEALAVPVVDPDARPRRDDELASSTPGPLPGGTARSLPDVRAFERRLHGPSLLSRNDSLLLQRGTSHPDEAYRLWAAAHDDNPTRQAELRARAEHLVEPPTISIVMPTYESDPLHLLEAIASVRNQTYPHWQLCIADDASPTPTTRATLERLVDVDDRIDVTFCPTNGGISAATNAALARATGELVGFMDHDDVLHPGALHWIVELLQEHPDLDVVYTDEEKLDPSGRRAEPFFKPDWSPDLLLSVNYVSHFTVMRRSLVEAVGGLRSEFDGSQDYDLVLRVTERTKRIGHVPKPLYAWRQTDRSTAADVGAKPEAHATSRRALGAALERRGVEAEVLPGHIPTWHHVRYQVQGAPLVSAIIPTRDRGDLLRRCIDEVRTLSGGHRVEVVVVDNDSSEPATLAYLDELRRTPDTTVVRYPERFNWARQINLGVAASRGELLLFLNNDALPTTADWLDELAGHAQRPEVGAVGCRLLFPDGRVQHEGIALHVGEAVAWNVRAPGMPVLAFNTRNTSGVTGACLMVRRAVFEAVRGFDEQLRVAFNDVDLGRRLTELGYRIVYTPWAELEHAESASRGALHPMDDDRFYTDRWGAPCTDRDPFYPSALDMADPVLRFRI